MEELLIRSRLEALQDGRRAVLVHYVNGSGEESERAIVPVEFYEHGGRQYVRAYCFLRHERRTFALRRMEIVGPENGQTADASGPATGDTQASLITSNNDTGSITAERQASNHFHGGAAAAGPIATDSQPRNTTAQAEGPSGIGEFFRHLFTIAGLLIVLWAMVDSSGRSSFLSWWNYSSGDDWSDSYQESFSGSEFGASEGAGSSDGARPDPPGCWTYRGYNLSRASNGRVMVARTDHSFDSGRQAHYWINSHLFSHRTGISDVQLLSRYVSADTDGNGHLSWREVETFQRHTYRRFTYRNNGRALPPDQFLAAGGGDCEDFALYTCGLLQFWGWNCKVASFYPPGGGSGHAIAMVWSAAPINGYGYIHVSGNGGTRVSGGQGAIGHRDENYTAGSSGTRSPASYHTAYLKPGYWVPIDYDSIGRFSNAMGSNWSLWALSDPVDIYGAVM